MNILPMYVGQTLHMSLHRFLTPVKNLLTQELHDRYCGLNSMYSSIYSALCRGLYNPATRHHPALFMCTLPPVNIRGPFKQLSQDEDVSKGCQKLIVQQQSHDFRHSLSPRSSSCWPVATPVRDVR